MSSMDIFFTDDYAREYGWSETEAQAVLKAIPYAPPTAVASNWRRTVESWGKAVNQVATMRAESPIFTAERLRDFARAFHQSYGTTLEPDAIAATQTPGEGTQPLRIREGE
jgi:hypothetical protein